MYIFFLAIDPVPFENYVLDSNYQCICIGLVEYSHIKQICA